MHDISRRQMLQRTLPIAAAVGVAGCSGGDSSTAEGGDSKSTTSGNGDASGDSGPDDSPDPDCSRLAGSPTPYDTSGTPFVFAFDYVDSWEVDDPLQGPGGRTQGVSSPIVTVDGETESAGLSLGQKFEPLTAAEVDEAIDSSTGGDYAPAEVRHEQSFGDETIRIVGFPDATIPYYETWLPYDGSYYHLTMTLLTSILRTEEGELCLDETVAGIETVRESLRPNPGTTIEEVQ